jgi:hypothetical protein
MRLRRCWGGRCCEAERRSGRITARQLAGARSLNLSVNMEGGLQELDETAYWLELLVETKNVSAKRLGPLLDETGQLLAIFVASVKTSKQKRHY